jgi:hypothetical protein
MMADERIKLINDMLNDLYRIKEKYMDLHFAFEKIEEAISYLKARKEIIEKPGSG